MSAGRFHMQKNFEGLITVFSSVFRQFSSRLVILGDGKLRGKYVKHANALGLRTCDLITQSKVRDADVYLTGYQTNPFKFMSRSKLFVLSSDWEGFPNALIEAMICGLPAVSTDCPTGPREILAPNSHLSTKLDLQRPQYGDYGILMPQLSTIEKDPMIDLWSETIVELLMDKALRQKYVLRGRKRVKDFDIANIGHKWERVLQTA